MTPTSVLRDRAVRALVAAEGISQAGSQMTYIVLPWFVLTTTGSPAKTSIVVAAEMAPVALFGLASGAATRRLGSRRTFLIADAARAVLLATIPTLHLLDALSFPLLVGLVFAVGTFMVPHATAQRVVIPELVGEDEARVGQTMSLLQTGMAIAGILGPALGGVLIAVIGETNVLYVDAATYVAAFVLIGLFVRPERTAHASDEPSGVLDGVRFLFRDRLLRAWMLSITGMNIVWTAMAVVFPVMVLERYGERPEILGWIFGAFGVGSVVGAVASYRFIGRVDRILLASTSSLGQTAAMWILLPDLPWPIVAASGAIAGVFFPMLNASVVTIRTMRTPIALRPTVHTAAVTVAMILAPLGALAAGPALERFDLAAVLAVILVGNTLCGSAIAIAGMRDRARIERPAPELA
ncbi:MAG TPA: MFS transporter [Gaiellaceae bacterium]|nr:MFS transporter [Gaiellaceae bacterium]